MKKIITMLLVLLGFTAIQAQNIIQSTAASLKDAPIVQNNVTYETLFSARPLIENTAYRPPAPVPEILYYKFDEAGATITNLASAPPAGTATATINGQSQGAPAICDVGSLQGIGGTGSANFVATGWDTNLGASSWSISMKTDSWPAGAFNYIFGDNTAGSFRSFANGAAGTDNIVLRGPFTQIIATGAAAAGAHTTVFVYDSSVPEMRAYLDGVLVNTVPQGAVNIAGTAFKVGGYSTSASLPAGAALDEFGFYNRALTPAEVTDLNVCPVAPPVGCMELVSQPTNFPTAPLNAYSIFVDGLGVERSIMDDFNVPAGTDQVLEEISFNLTRSAVPYVIPSNIEIKIRANNAGTPGAVLSTQTVSGANLIDNGVVGVAFGREFHDLNLILPTPVLLTAGTTYWVEFQSAPPDNYFVERLNSSVVSGAPTWVDYNDSGGLQPGVNIFGENRDLVFSLCTTDSLGDPPVIACPANIVVNNAPGTCGAVANFAGVAFDTEDGNISGDIIATPPSGSVFPVGDTTVTLSVTDSDGNTSTCNFTVTVNDNEPPVAVCQDLTLDLDPVTGTVSITAADVDNGSTDNCGIASMTLDVSSFDCSNTGANTVTMTVTDNSGNSSTCTSTVTVQDVTAPEVFCVGGFGQFTESEDFEGASIPSGWSTVIEVGSADWTFGSGDMPLGPDFATNAAIFDDDAAGNGEVNLARLLSPAYDLTGASNVQLSFEYAIQDFIGSGTLEAEVWDGAAWQQVLFIDDMDVAPVNTGDIDVSAFANPAFQVRYTYDDEGDWAWGAGVDNFLLTYEATAGGGLDVFLDANGMASVDPNDLVTGVNEACGYTITAGGAGGGTNGSITTVFDTNNGLGAGATVFYDLTVGPNDIEVTDLDINTDATGPFNLDLYTLVGTYVGNETNAGAWGAAAASGTGTGAGTDLPSNAVLGTSVILSANTTYGIAVNMDVDVNYSGTGSNPAPGQLNYSNADLSLDLGSSQAGLFSGTPFTPRIWNGTINYIVGGGSGLDFTCADLGENLVEVTVTDASGNVSTCTAVVNVIDITAPIITCGPEPTVSETVSDSPGLAIPDNTTVSTTIEVTDEFDITDLNVDLNITHTWVGDLRITLQSPTGTEVLIFDGGADGCSGDNIIDLYDDESPNALSCMAGSSDAFPLADYRPSNPLSAFDGESTVGTWTISIEDTAGGDTGTLNTWGITYSYANTNTDVVIELGPDGTATIDPYDIINNVVEACGIDTAAVDVPTVSCADIGTTIVVTVFVIDTSGNLASCTANVTVVDLLAPVLTCPADQTVDPGAGNLFYIVPDYFATGEATADDNCTDPVTDTTQDPAPGSTLTDGVYTITMTATDEYGNTSTCNFELTVESTLGVNQNSLDAGIALYPNPASNVVNLVNKTNISLEKMMIYDINGKLVNQTDLRTMQGEKAVDVSSLAAGVYVVQIIGDNASTVKRLIKE